MNLNDFSMRLDGRVVVVTGASGGLGRGCVEVLQGAGARVAAVDRDAAGLLELLDGLDGSVGQAAHYVADSADAEAMTEVIARVSSDLGKVSGLVTFAGVHQTQPLMDITGEEWSRVMRANVDGTLFSLQAAARAMEPGGSAVLVSSIAARGPRPNAAHYGASKAAVLSLTRSAAAALGPAIRVNAVCPGVVLTPMWDRVFSERDRIFGAGAAQRYVDSLEERTLLKRLGTSAEIGNVVAFLLSDLSSYVTGQSLNVDGGMEFG